MTRLFMAIAAVAACALASVSMAQTVGGRTESLASMVTSLTQAQRSAMAQELVDRWGPVVQQRSKGDLTAWAAKLGKVVQTADVANVLNATTMPTLDTMHAALSGYVMPAATVPTASLDGGSVGTLAIGSTISDVSYTPLPNGRCRVADSRVISSKLVPNTERSIDTEDVASYASQGGNGSAAGDGSTNCALPSFATALAVSVTILNAEGSGIFKIYPTGTLYTRGNSVAYNTGMFASTADVIVTSCQACALELTVRASHAVHYVIDVIGYFMPPQATALDCVNTANSELVLAAGATGNALAPACATGYTQTATNCEATSWQVPFVYFKSGTCSAQNNSAGSATIRASRTCCRVPGR